jgi:hypothetical protein
MARFSDFLERKIERLRLGQAACEFTSLPSDPETRIALVPLTEGEYTSSLTEADKALAGDSPAGLALRDEIQRQMVIYYAARDVQNLQVKFFEEPEEVLGLDAHDLNHLYDVYLELVHLNSPSMMGMSEEDFLALKNAWRTIEWSELSGPQWFAAQRFINSIQRLLLTGRSSGSPSTMKSTPMSDEQDSAENANTSQNTDTVFPAESS